MEQVLVVSCVWFLQPAMDPRLQFSVLACRHGGAQPHLSLLIAFSNGTQPAGQHSARVRVHLLISDLSSSYWDHRGNKALWVRAWRGGIRS